MKRVMVLLVVVALFLGSCGTQGQEVGELQRESRSIQPENAQSVRARLMVGAGELKINAEGLQREGDAYVNDAYGDSDVTLEVDVRGGVGEINLEVV
ncbi:MAG: hypothetical protein ACRDTR_02290 [Rubrobacter sp.]